MQGGERRRGCETVGMCVGVYICTFVGSGKARDSQICAMHY